MKSLRVGKMTKLPVERGHAVATLHVLPTQAPRSSRVSLDIEASRCARIPSPPTKPLVLILWHNQETRRFSGELPQILHVNSGREPPPCTGYCPRLRLGILATMRPALDPVRPPGLSSRAYLSLHSSEAPQG
jgi:hypothetical protein